MTEAVLHEERTAEAAASFTVEGGPGVAALARAEIDALSPRVGEAVASDLALLVSELVTNSYRHSGARRSGIKVRVWIQDDGVRCEVVDQGGGFAAEPVPPQRRGVGGWGLFIVDKLAERWGVRPGPPTRVWFELGSTSSTV